MKGKKQSQFMEDKKMNKPIVYFTKEVSPEAAIRAYDALRKNLPGNIGIKLHSGEPGNQNFPLWKLNSTGWRWI